MAPQLPSHQYVEQSVLASISHENAGVLLPTMLVKPTTKQLLNLHRIVESQKRMSLKKRLNFLLGPEISEEEVARKYTFQDLIGSGATCKVYAAIDNITQQKVAIKIFDKADMIHVRGNMEGKEDTEELAVTRVRRRLEKIINEILISKAVNHKNIIKYIEGFETSHRICMVLEHVDGTDLLEHTLLNGKMTENKAKEVCRKIIDAVAYIHENNIWHRDLKLENIMITKDLNVKLIDFGLAEITKPGGRLQTVCGTPLYCSPEMMLSSDLTRKVGFLGEPADIWSAGILIYALVSGCAPYNDSSLKTLRYSLRKNNVVYPSYFSGSLVNLLKAVLHINFRDRPTCRSLLSYEWFHKSAERDNPIFSFPADKLALKSNISEETRASSSFEFENNNSDDAPSFSIYPEAVRHIEPLEIRCDYFKKDTNFG